VLEKVCSQVLILCKGRVAAHDSIGHLRERMHESSLDGIFGQLTREHNYRDVAGHILQVMQA
jgi:hypothetical protein